jgi:ATP-dependent DNA ligase
MLTATRRAQSSARTFACTSSAGFKARAQAAGQDGCDFSGVADRIAVGYRLRMFKPKGFIEPCLPSLASTPPAGPDWGHEIKHDGYRLIVHRDGAIVRLFTRRGYEWTGRFPSIADAAGKLRARTFTLDGEAVVCGADGIAVFDALHGQRRLREAFLYAFDLIEMDGEDLFRAPPGLTQLARAQRR